MTGRSIWILNHYAVTPDLPGGTRHFDIARRMAAAGDRVTVFAASFSYVTFEDVKLAAGEHAKVEERDGVTFVWLRTFPYCRNDWRRYLNMLSYVPRVLAEGWRLPRRTPAVPKPDVVLGSSVHLLAVLAAWLLARLYGARFVMEVRDIWPQTLVDAGHLSERHPVVMALTRLESFLYRRADHILYVPPLAGPFLHGRGVAWARMTWVPNGAEFSSLSQEARPPDAGVLRGMYTGSLGRTNGLGVILDGAEALRRRGVDGVAFDIVGRGPERDQLDAARAARGLDCVRLCEAVPKTEIPALLASADFLILCEQNLPALSKYGGSPNKLYDYLASARPIIVSSDFIKEDVEGIGFGLRVPPEDGEALADAVETLLRMTPEERDAMGRQGRAHAETHYSMEIIVAHVRRAAFGEDAAS